MSARKGSITAAAAALGRLGGSARSEAKTAASRANGAKGGRPRKLVRDGLTYTMHRLGERTVSVVVSGSKGKVAALLAGVLRWPSDEELSEALERRVRLVDGGADATEALYEAEE